MRETWIAPERHGGGEYGVAAAVEKMEKNGREKYVAAVRAARNDVAFLCVSGAGARARVLDIFTYA